MRAQKKEAVLKEFAVLWKNLFTTPVHLDSVLSKVAPHRKAVLAQTVPRILLRPVSLAESLGVGLPPGEPWTLGPAQLAEWKPARHMSERLYEFISGERASAGDVDGSVRREDFPPWFVDELENTWGKEAASRIVERLGKPAPLSIRLKNGVDRESFLKELRARKELPVRVEPSSISPWGIRFSGYAPILGDEAYERGLFEIQDEGSQLMALFAIWPEVFGEILQETPEPRDVTAPAVPPHSQPLIVVDACAGAGGKTLALAEALRGHGRVFSYDVSETKLRALRRRTAKAGLTNTQAVALKEGEEERVIGRFAKSADVVLVDAPCSGWGVLRRNPDIKWRQDEAARTKMPALQLRLLRTYSSLVKPGGRLVFGVCTFRKSETTDVVREFLSVEPDFVLNKGGYLGPGSSDGFFMQAFTRKC